MKNPVNEILKESGDISAMRVMSFICVCTACYIAIIGVKTGTDLIQLSAIVGTLLAGGIGGKALQKGREGQPST